MKAAQTSEAKADSLNDAPEEIGLSEKSSEDAAQSLSELTEISEKLGAIERRLEESETARQAAGEELLRRIEEINRANRESSAGSVRGARSEYLSPAEVREMTPAEVRKNYSRIVDSMGKWN